MESRLGGIYYCMKLIAEKLIPKLRTVSCKYNEIQVGQNTNYFWIKLTVIMGQQKGELVNLLVGIFLPFGTLLNSFFQARKIHFVSSDLNTW